MPKRKRNLTGIGDVLKDMKRTTKLGETLEKAQIWEHWETLVGPELSAHGRPQTLQDGTLRIEADSPVWMHKYAFKKYQIIRRINTHVKKKLVKDIFMVLISDGDYIGDEEED